MKQPILFIALFIGFAFVAGGSAFCDDGDEMKAFAHIIASDYGKLTTLFVHNEKESEVYFNQFKDIFSTSEGMSVYNLSNPLEIIPPELKQKLIDFFIEIREQFYDDLENKPEIFTVIASVEESQITDTVVSVLSIGIPKLNYVYIATSFGDEILLCNVGE